MEIGNVRMEINKQEWRFTNVMLVMVQVQKIRKWCHFDKENSPRLYRTRLCVIEAVFALMVSRAVLDQCYALMVSMAVLDGN